MKILLVFTLYLISGPVGCFNVIGYPGGRLAIFCKHYQYTGSDIYFCKERTEQCVHVKTQDGWIHKDRLSLKDSAGLLTVIYKDLRLEDAGLYQCGETGVWNHTVNLRVKTDPCCLTPKTEIGYLGENVTLNCSYPEQFLRSTKSFHKLDNESLSEEIRTSKEQKGRFSISEDTRSKVLSLRISELREDDGGIYYCETVKGGASVSYNSFFTKTHLQVFESRLSTTLQPPAEIYGRTSTVPTTPTSDEGLKETPGTPTAGPTTAFQTPAAPTTPTSVEEHSGLKETPGLPTAVPTTAFQTPAAPTETISEEEPSTPGSTITITVIICVVLVIGGLIFYKRRCSETQDSPITSRRTITNEIIHENDPAENQSITMSQDYQNIELNSNQSDSVYESLDPRSIDPNSVYQNFNPKRLIPNSNQSESIYQNLKLTSTK